MDEFFNSADVTLDLAAPSSAPRTTPDAVDAVAGLLGRAERPVIIFGTDVWADRAEVAALALVDALGIPVITNGMGRGIIPGGHPLLVTKARGQALGTSDLVIVVGTPLDFRLGYGVFGGKDGAPTAPVVHIADSPGQVSGHAELAASVSGDLTAILDGARGRRRPGRPRKPDWSPWVDRPPGHGGAPRPSATASCSTPRPTRSTRPASTASWCRGWPTTRSSSATAATSSASPASSSSRSVPAAGSTPARTAASAPGSVPRWPPGSPGRPRRSCCCSATAPPASR